MEKICRENDRLLAIAKNPERVLLLDTIILFFCALFADDGYCVELRERSEAFNCAIGRRLLQTSARTGRERACEQHERAVQVHQTRFASNVQAQSDQTWMTATSSASAAARCRTQG